MIPCISVENMRQSDAYTIANLVPGRELMYRAAYGVFKAYDWPGRTAILVGSGNNGGDGFALSWILKEHGFDCTIFTLSRKLSPDSAYYAEKAKASEVPVCPFETGVLNGFDTVVDCLLGTGFSGSVRGIYRDAIQEINGSSGFVLSVDINSGMNGDSGEAELAVRSDLTVTIGYVKTGLVTENAGNYIKRLVCTDIGIVLVREEGFLTEETCPPWLDRNVTKHFMTLWEETLLGELIGLARATEGNQHLISDPVTRILAEILKANVPDEARYNQFSAKIQAAKREMVPDCFLCANPCGRTAALDPKVLKEEPLPVQEVKSSILQELRKIASSPRNREQDRNLYRGLVILGLEDYSPEELTSLFFE